MIQPFVHRLDVLLQYAVKLESLAICNSNTLVIRIFCSELIDTQPLCRLYDSPRQTATKHHVFAWFQLASDEIGTDVAIVLCIHTVKADELKVIATKAAAKFVLQVISDRST